MVYVVTLYFIIDHFSTTEAKLFLKDIMFTELILVCLITYMLGTCRQKISLKGQGYCKWSIVSIKVMHHIIL